jgi:hypothetical protein
MRSAVETQTFEGRIAGLGTSSGTRIVLGLWRRTPLGPFADAMIERADGERILIAPAREVAELVAGLYGFDRVLVEPLRARGEGRTLLVRSPALQLDVEVGRVSPLGVLLRSVPRPVARSWRFAAAVHPLARLLVPGAGTAGTAGGAREYYGVTDARGITAASGAFEGEDLGGLTRLDPPVRFGFAQTPAAPTLVDVVTTVRRTGSVRV